MAHWAEIDENNVVIRVTVMANDHRDGNEGGTWLHENLGGRWIQTSYNANFRGCYAGPGFIYDEDLDEFIPPTPLTLGFIKFRNNDFKLGKGVFVPQLSDDDQQRMVDEISGPVVVADIGAGIGVVGLSVALENPGATVHLVEPSEIAFEYLQKNTESFSEELNKINSHTVLHHMGVEYCVNVVPQCDYIVAGLPVYDDSITIYDNPEIPRESAYGGYDGLQVIKHLTPVAEHCLKVGGVLWVTSPNGGYLRCEHLFDKTLFTVEEYGSYIKVTRIH